MLRSTAYKYNNEIWLDRSYLVCPGYEIVTTEYLFWYISIYIQDFCRAISQNDNPPCSIRFDKQQQVSTSSTILCTLVQVSILKYLLGLLDIKKKSQDKDNPEKNYLIQKYYFCTFRKSRQNIQTQRNTNFNYLSTVITYFVINNSHSNITIQGSVWIFYLCASANYIPRV